MSEAPALAELYSLKTSDVRMMVKQYGVLTTAVLDCMPDLAPGDLSRLDAGRLTYAERHEMALQPSDFLEVSTTLALEGHAPVGFTMHA